MHLKFVERNHKTEVHVFCSRLYKIGRKTVVKQGKLSCRIGISGLEIVVEQGTAY
jgi:hypothetical protein